VLYLSKQNLETVLKKLNKTATLILLGLLEISLLLRFSKKKIQRFSKIKGKKLKRVEILCCYSTRKGISRI